MPAAVPTVPERLPRRARYLIPRDTPRRSEVLAAVTLAVLLVGVLFAQLTLVLTVTFHAFGKISRLRPSWLLAPAACGLLWVLAVGPGWALAGFWAVPSGVRGLLAGVVTHPATLARLSGVPGIIGRGTGGQLPVALILAAGIAAAGWWARWLHTNEWEMPGYRAGLVSRCRRWWTVTFIRSGGVVTRDGACLGTDLESGRAATVSWQEATGGVLVTGADPAAVSAAGFQLAHAAIRRRKPVLVVDLAGNRELPAALAAVCAVAGAPLLTFGAGGTGCYEPLRDTEPGRAAGLVMGIIDWRGVPEPARLACRDCLVTAFTLLDAAPPEADESVLDELVSLLRPGALRGRSGRVPAWHPGREALANSAETAERWLAADPATGGLVTGQLATLRASELGRWLCPAPGGQIGLGEVIRERAVALFSLSAPGGAAGMIATLLAFDISTRYADLHRSGTAPDGLVWFSHCDRVAATALAGLAGAATGLVPVLTTTSPGVAGRLAGQVDVCVVHRLADLELASRLAALTGTRLAPATQFVPPAPLLPTAQLVPPAQVPPLAHWPDTGTSPAAPRHDAGVAGPPVPFGTIRTFNVPAETLCGLGNDEVVLISAAAAGRNGTRPRRVVQARAVGGRIPRVRPPGQPGRPWQESSPAWPR